MLCVYTAEPICSINSTIIFGHLVARGVAIIELPSPNIPVTFAIWETRSVIGTAYNIRYTHERTFQLDQPKYIYTFTQ